LIDLVVTPINVAMRIPGITHAEVANAPYKIMAVSGDLLPSVASTSLEDKGAT
jgi:hypothetical protein